MGDLATLPTFQPSPANYTHTELNAIFAALTLANGAVSFSKFQAIATDKLLGRATAGSGNVEEIACTAAGRAMLAAADAAAQRAALGVISNTLATNKLLGRATAGTGNVEEIACTAAGRALLAAADAAAQRTALGITGSSMLTARLAADVTYYATTTLVNIPGLSVALEIGTYRFRAFLMFNGYTAQATLHGEGGLGLSVLHFIQELKKTGNSVFLSINYSLDTGSGLNELGEFLVILEGTTVVGSPGILTVQAAQSIASGSVTLVNGSYLEVVKYS